MRAVLLVGAATTWLAACGQAALHPVVREPDAGADTPGCPTCVFPLDPIIVTTPGAAVVPPDIASRFDAGGADAGSAGGPCLVEPEPGSLFPRNWLRPRFRWSPLPARTVVELRLKVDVEPNELVVYTTGTSWTMDVAMWAALSESAPGHPIAMTVRSLSLDGAGPPAAGTTGAFTIAPVSAPGSIVYWSINAATGNTALDGFQIGQETVGTLVRPRAGRCVGCHTSTPDGEFVMFSDADMPDGQHASLAIRSSRDGVSEPPFLTTAGRALLGRRNQHLGVFSPAHWRTGEHIALSLLNLQLVWTDLEAPSLDPGVGWGALIHEGDPGPVAAWPSWSHDGRFVVYASGQGTIAGGVLSNADIYRVPYDDAQRGGTAVAVQGASDPTANEFYPTLSPDDEVLAFSRVGAADGTSYNNPKSELYVLPLAETTPTRVAANDPSSCQGTKSPGVTNSWPKWAPDATVTGGKTYYWLTFSSTRGGGVPQLYVTPIVREGDGGALETYPALYLWNQSPLQGNHTPAWDNLTFSIQ
jgi:hypothetical protein